ncbi:MAG: gliding motility-associated C-terminal domain-containing protein [Bacteroidetes bacterium]|nr:gliding motility-associated C-terminal domain-containing protein [Bacteroidota bacterium]
MNTLRTILKSIHWFGNAGSIFLVLTVFSYQSGAVCSSTVSVFPYNQSFETSMGGWSSGGTGNDWAWGSPTKPIINSAGNGVKCWISGGLTTSFYSNGERSWVESPCFDFSSLPHPYVSFRIFWETEHQYDGCTFQYSLNGGASWANVGSSSDPVNCNNDHWFNFSSITNLSTLATVREGWTGTILPSSGSCQGGFGSGGWILAKHCMPYLAGEPSVKFRFAFGAGTSCNNYDGFAFDDVTIMEAPPVTSNFSFSCVSGNTVSFTDLSGTCADSWSWNFGDPGSGANNISTLQNPVHTFSASGSFNVTLTASGSCSGGTAFPEVISIIQSSAVPHDVSCYGGNDGSADIAVTGGGGPFSYQWNTSPVQNTSTAVGLSPGSYTFFVNGNNVCPDTGTVTIGQPLIITHSVSTVAAHCGNDNGVATATISGGTAPYHYNWSSGDTTSSVNNLPPGNYLLTVNDSKGCTVTNPFVIGQKPPLAIFLTSADASCGISNGTVHVNVNGGTSPFQYAWLPFVSNANVASNLASGDYVVTVTDSSGCTKQDTATILQQPGLLVAVSSSPDSCSKNIGAVYANVLNGTPPFQYTWNPGGIFSQDLTHLGGGDFTVTVTDSMGCTKDKSVHVDDYGSFTMSLGDDSKICPGNELILYAGNFSSYLWQDTSTLSSLTIHEPGIFWVTVMNSFGCYASDTIVVKEECLDDVIAPNAFTPNGDGRNDFFFASGTNVTSFNMKIFNRWGEKIFESDNMNSPWNGSYKGKEQESDVYVWLLNFSIDNNEPVRKVGRVFLIR